MTDGIFPRQCKGCGKTYPTFESFYHHTRAPGTTGLRQSKDRGRVPFVEMMRLCDCGTSMIQPCDDRRKHDLGGGLLREQFDHLLDVLAEKGCADDIATFELRKVVRGEDSDVISALL